MNKTQVLHGLTATLKLLSLLCLVAGQISPTHAVEIIALASGAKDLLLTAGDWLDDGKVNKSFLGLFALGALILFGSGCTSGASLARALAKDPATAGFSIQLVTPWGQQNISLARVGNTNSTAHSEGGAVIINK